MTAANQRRCWQPGRHHDRGGVYSEDLHRTYGRSCRGAAPSRRRAESLRPTGVRSFLTAPKISIPPELASLVEYLELPLPDRMRLRQIIDEVLVRALPRRTRCSVG